MFNCDHQDQLDRIERKLDVILHREHRIMSATDDLKQKLQDLDDEADKITAGIQVLQQAQSQGNQAAVDAAVADLSTSVDNVKSHVDAAQAALNNVPSPTPTPTPPTDGSGDTSGAPTPQASRRHT